MVWRLLSNLTTKMVIIVMTIHLFFINILYFGLGAVVEDGYQSQFIDYVRADAANLAANISGGKNLTSRINMQALDNAILTGQTLFLRILDDKNEVIELVGNTESRSSFIEDFKFGDGDSNIYHIAAQLYDNNEHDIGTLQIGYDESLTQEQIDIAYRRCLFLSLLYALLSFTATVFFGQRITKPIQSLQSLTRTIAHGQYHTKIAIGTSVKEIKALASSIEHMREELVNQANSMEHLALHDGLTSLPNRRFLQDRVEQVINSRQLHFQSNVLMVIDLDRFKEINDSFGHLIGDNVLQKSARRLLDTLRKSDTIARLGGDEFAIFLPNTSMDAAITLANKLVSELSREFECEGHMVSIGASIGLAGYPYDGLRYEDLLRLADIAMYVAKRSGEHVRSYHADLDHDALKRLTLISDLKIGINNNQLFATYQPKINMLNERLSGVELLVRWQHPTKGTVPPDEFIAEAERGGLISALTQWVLREGIKQAALWHQKGWNIPVAINLSPKNLIEKGLYQSIVQLLEEYKLPPHLLELEITESSMFVDPIKANEVLNSLDKQGIKLAIDDFGTGYSSLVQLRKMPVSVLKIDRSFVDRMYQDSSNAAIVSATIFMAHELGMTVVAEGVEDNDTLSKLKELKCDVAQGHLFSKSMIADDFEHWFSKAPHACSPPAQHVNPKLIKD